MKNQIERTGTVARRKKGPLAISLRDVGIQFATMGTFGQAGEIKWIEPRYQGDQFVGSGNVTAGECLINAIIDGPHRNAVPTTYKVRFVDRRDGAIIRESEPYHLDAWSEIDARRTQKERSLQEQAWRDHNARFGGGSGVGPGGGYGMPSMGGGGGMGWPPGVVVQQAAPTPTGAAPAPAAPQIVAPSGASERERMLAEQLGYQRGVIEYQNRALEEERAAAREGRMARPVEPPPPPPPAVVAPVAPPPAPMTALDQMDQMIAFLERQKKINMLMGMGQPVAPAIPPEVAQEIASMRAKLAEMEAEKRANAAVEAAKAAMAATMPKVPGQGGATATPAGDSLADFLKRRDEDERTLEKLKSRLGLMGPDEESRPPTTCIRRRTRCRRWSCRASRRRRLGATSACRRCRRRTTTSTGNSGSREQRQRTPGTSCGSWASS